jgi:Tol biopolymer transport system component
VSLSDGTRLGAYEITGQLGAGGMGEVYRAADTTLKRDVALKVLPPAFVEDADRLARFQREAEILASLNHTNIAQVYGLEKANGQTAIVMELVEGPTLADRIEAGPIPPDDAMGIALQVVAALEAAHDKGIVHRDLKPANVKIKDDGTVKVLDFGISKPLDASAISGSSPVASTPAVTQTGVILGTAAYMSPEQAKGKFVDERTDIWAFGCLLYEMLTGQPAFGGEDVLAILARVIERDTDLKSIPGTISPAVRHTIKLCLEKDLRRRIADIRDVKLALDGAFDDHDASMIADAQAAARATLGPLRWGTLVTVAGVAVAAALGLWLRSPPEPRADPARLTLSLPSGTELPDGPSVTISPDGARVAYVATSGGRQQLYLRPMNGFEAEPITGTEGAAAPFFSPDGRWLGFFADGQLKKISASGGVVETLAEAQDVAFSGGSWGPNDTIVFRGPLGGLLEVSTEGGAPRPLMGADQGVEVGFVGSPTYLPGGEAVLLTSAGPGVRTAAGNTVEVLTLETGARKVLLQGGSDARYLPTGHLVFLRDGTLMAVPFDLDRLELAGTPVPVIEGVRQPWSGLGAFSCSGTGACVYVAGGTPGQRTVALVDRAGTSRTLPLRPQSYGYPRFSPSGEQIAFWITQLRCDIALYDLGRDTLTIVASDGDNHSPIWTHSGERITYASRKLDSPGSEVFSTPADGSGAEERISETPLSLGPLAQLSTPRTGDVLAFVDQGDIWRFPLSGEGEPQPFFESRAAETSPAFSPDGSWLAYVSDESSRQQVYVRPFPGPGARYPISTDGGTEPVWAPDGHELFFRDGDRMMVVEVRTEPTFTATRPSLLFTGPFTREEVAAAYDVSPDGQTFVMLNPGEHEEAATQISVLLGWFTELQERVPVP